LIHNESLGYQLKYQKSLEDLKKGIDSISREFKKTLKKEKSSKKNLNADI
jgi:hypothetical protein